MTPSRRWSPARGDVVWARTESSIRRPAFVVSPAAYSYSTGFALVCEIVEEPTGYPFEVVLPPRLADCGAVLADRVICLHVRSWGLMRVVSVDDEVTAEVLLKLGTLTGLSFD